MSVCNSVPVIPVHATESPAPVPADGNGKRSTHSSLIAHSDSQFIPADGSSTSTMQVTPLHAFSRAILTSSSDTWWDLGVEPSLPSVTVELVGKAVAKGFLSLASGCTVPLEVALSPNEEVPIFVKVMTFMIPLLISPTMTPDDLYSALEKRGFVPNCGVNQTAFVSDFGTDASDIAAVFSVTTKFNADDPERKEALAKALTQFMPMILHPHQRLLNQQVGFLSTVHLLIHPNLMAEAASCLSEKEVVSSKVAFDYAHSASLEAFISPLLTTCEGLRSKRPVECPIVLHRGRLSHNQFVVAGYQEQKRLARTGVVKLKTLKHNRDASVPQVSIESQGRELISLGVEKMKLAAGQEHRREWAELGILLIEQGKSLLNGVQSFDSKPKKNSKGSMAHKKSTRKLAPSNA